MIKVLLADDHHIVRKGIRGLLEEAGDIEVIAEAGDGQEAIDLTQRLRPDVLLIDIGMPRMNGIQATQRLREQDSPTQIVILSMHSSPFLVRQALSSGARGYLLKQSLLEELLLAVRAAALKKTYLSPSISHVVLDGFLSQADAHSAGPLDELTPREKEVLQMIAEGDTSSVIAQKLSLSANTVDKHRTNLMAKLDVHDIAGLTRLAIKCGLVFLEE